MILEREDLRKKLKQGEIHSVYLLFGEETFLRDLAVQTITEKTLSGDFTDFDKNVFNLAETTIDEALVAARRLPFGGKNVVEIRNVRISSVASKDTLKEKDEGLLREYLINPAQTSVVIFVADEFDRRRKLAKLFVDNATVVEFKRLQEIELIQWIKKKFKSFNLDVESKAVDLLISLVGNSLRDINLECEKLATAAMGDVPIVTSELVAELVPDRFVPENFALADYLLEKNRSKAMETLTKLLNEGVEPVMLLGLIASSFRRLFLVKQMMKRQIEKAEIVKVMKIPYSRQEEFFKLARRSDFEQLARVLVRIAEADFAIKSSKATPRLQLEMLVLELTA